MGPQLESSCRDGAAASTVLVLGADNAARMDGSIPLFTSGAAAHSETSVEENRHIGSFVSGNCRLMRFQAESNWRISAFA